MKIFSISLVLALISGQVKSCGISTHTEIIHRAFEFYDNPAFGPGEVRRIIQEQQGAFMAGAPFPDAFYNSLCKEGQFHYVSEDHHWGEYQKVAWDYFRRTYPDPIGNEKAERLLAFLLGMTSHQVADVLWHNLQDIKDGLIEMLAETTFDGDFGTAHDLADFGGDILGVVEWDTSYANKWFVPTEDMYNILKEYYNGNDQGITTLLIEECSAMLLAGRLAEQELGAVIYSNYASQSAIFLDEYQEYFMGGVDDMAAWTRLVWDMSLAMAVNGTDHCHIPKNPMDIHCDLKQTTKVDSAQSSIKRERKERFFTNLERKLGVSLKDFAKQKIQTQKSGNGVSFEPKKTVSTEDKFEKEQVETIKNNKAIEWHASFYVPSAYAKLGLSMATGDVNDDGLDDLLLGAPGFEGKGCFYVVFGSPNVLIAAGEHNLEVDADLRLCGNLSDPYSRFGHDFVVKDFNGDGLNDIIVGAPTSGLRDVLYDGLVHVFLATKTSRGTIEFSSDVSDVTFSPPKSDSSRSSTFGWTVTSWRDDAFVVSARHRTDGQNPQTGSIYEINSSGEVSNIANGKLSYEWSGSVVVSLSQDSGLAVGAPTWNDCSVDPCRKSAGRVDILSPDDGSVISSLFGESEFSQFGYSLEESTIVIESVPRRVLIVGSPTFTYDSGVIDNHKHAGSVKVYDLDKLLALESQDGAFLLRLDSDKIHGRFGRSVHASDTHLFVGAPRYHGAIANRESGSVFGFSLTGSLSIGNPTTDDCGFASSTPCPNDVADVILTSPDDEIKSQFGHSIQTVKSGNEQFVLVSAPKSSIWATQSGTVYVYKNI